MPPKRTKRSKERPMPVLIVSSAPKWEATFSHHNLATNELTTCTYELHLPLLRVIVTRRHGADPALWFLECRELRVEYQELVSRDIVDAKIEALDYIGACLKKMLRSVEAFTGYSARE